MNWTKIYTFLLFTFGISWTTAGAIKLLNIQLSNPLALIMIVLGFMSVPAIAAFIVQRNIYKRQLHEIGLAFDWRKYRWYIVTICAFVMLILLTLISVWFFGNVLRIEQFGLLDLSQGGFVERLGKLLRSAGEVSNSDLKDISSIGPFGLLAIAIIGGVFSGFSINGLVAFGEEFGWRGLLLTETKNLGFLEVQYLHWFDMGIVARTAYCDGAQFP
jgi:uncharacterized protein